MLDYETFDTLRDAMAHLDKNHRRNSRGLKPVLLFQAKDETKVKLALMYSAEHEHVKRMLDNLPEGKLYLVYSTSPENELERIELKDRDAKKYLTSPERTTFGVTTYDAARAAAITNAWFSRWDIFLVIRQTHVDVIIGKENAERYATDAHDNGETLADIQVVRANMHSMSTQPIAVGFKTVCVFTLDN